MRDEIRSLLHSALPSLSEVFHQKRDGSDSFAAQEKTVHGAPKEVFTSIILRIYCSYILYFLIACNDDPPLSFKLLMALLTISRQMYGDELA